MASRAYLLGLSLTLLFQTLLDPLLVCTLDLALTHFYGILGRLEHHHCRVVRSDELFAAELRVLDFGTAARGHARTLSSTRLVRRVQERDSMLDGR